MDSGISGEISGISGISGNPESGLEMSRLLRPRVLLSLFTVLLVALANGFIEPVLSGHLERRLNISVGGMNAIIKP